MRDVVRRDGGVEAETDEEGAQGKHGSQGEKPCYQ
jgi:hypothetical protein